QGWRGLRIDVQHRGEHRQRLFLAAGLGQEHAIEMPRRRVGRVGGQRLAVERFGFAEGALMVQGMGFLGKRRDGGCHGDGYKSWGSGCRIFAGVQDKDRACQETDMTNPRKAANVKGRKPDKLMRDALILALLREAEEEGVLTKRLQLIAA